jgi:poly(3-hydroxybutyrate) depolymerase
VLWTTFIVALQLLVYEPGVAGASVLKVLRVLGRLPIGNRCAQELGRNLGRSIHLGAVARLEYKDCADGAAVVLHTIEGGGHSWPGGTPMTEWLVGATSRSIDASSLMWASFESTRFPETD